MLVARLFIYTGFILGCLRSVLFSLGAEGFEETVVSSLFSLVLVATGAALTLVNTRPPTRGTEGCAGEPPAAREAGEGRGGRGA